MDGWMDGWMGVKSNFRDSPKIMSYFLDKGLKFGLGSARFFKNFHQCWF
jgi:hypothetical protein